MVNRTVLSLSPERTSSFTADIQVPASMDGIARVSGDERARLVTDLEQAVGTASRRATTLVQDEVLARVLRDRRGTQIAWCDHLTHVEPGVCADVQVATMALARLERIEGSPPERAVVLLKGITERAASRDTHPELLRALRSEVVRWAVEAYYGG